MVFLPWNPFNYVDEEGTEITKNRLIFKPQNGDVIGLRIITQHMYAGNKANVVVIKPSLRFQNPNFECFLKSCHLCDKELRFDKDVYMYRGDQGFCSVECRERQIYLDEMKEIEKSVKKFRIDQFKQHKPFSSSKGRPIAVLL